MKTKEEMMVMSQDELVEYASSMNSLSEYYRKQIERMKEILSAVGIAYETYKRELNG